jgi:hypothetical protein
MVKFFDVLTSDLQALVELRPEGKVCTQIGVLTTAINQPQSETVFTISAADLTVRHRPDDFTTETFLDRTPIQTLVKGYTCNGRAIPLTASVAFGA